MERRRPRRQLGPGKSPKTVAACDRHSLWGFAPVHCTRCFGAGVVVVSRPERRVCECVLRAVYRTVCYTVHTIRQRPWYSAEWTPYCDESSHCTMINYCCDVDLAIRAVLSPYEAELLKTRRVRRNQPSQYHDLYYAEEIAGAEMIRRGLYPVCDYLHRDVAQAMVVVVRELTHRQQRV